MTMLSELGKICNQTEASPCNNPEIKDWPSEGEIFDKLPDIQEIPDMPRVPEIPPISEVPRNQEGTRILKPNLELIRTQSLEAVRQYNVEKTQATVNENEEYRELTEEEKQYLRENTRLSDAAIDNIRVDADGNYHLKCRNEELDGKCHETTGVKYVEKTITVDGVEIKVVVPEFAAIFDCEIPAEIWENGDKEIFKNCTEQLRDYLEAHPEMKSQFNEQQLEQIMRGEPYIKGYTWHHTEIPGQMQLVETKVHAVSGHTGGNLIWCGGVR